MPVRFVFTRNDKKFVSRAIMWFEQRRTFKERRCSHGLYVFNPMGPVFLSEALSFEAMERGVWMDVYDKALGEYTVVAEFVLDLPEPLADEVTRRAVEKYSSWYYDFFGVAQNAVWLLLRKWFWTVLRWAKFAWKFEVPQGEAFCTGLLWFIAKIAEDVEAEYNESDRSRNWSGGIGSAREATPKRMIDACFNHPECYKLIGGTAQVVSATETTTNHEEQPCKREHGGDQGHSPADR